MTVGDVASGLATLFAKPQEEERIRRILDALGGERGLYWAGPEPLIAVLGEQARSRVQALFDLVRACLEICPGLDVMDGPEELVQYLQPKLACEPVEGFWVVSLDARARVVGYERVAQGTLTACLVHPREVFAPALRVRAASIVVFHNHPSGDPEPSLEDTALTERLAAAGRLLGIPVVDHIIIARGGVRSIFRPE